MKYNKQELFEWLGDAIFKDVVRSKVSENVLTAVQYSIETFKSVNKNPIVDIITNMDKSSRELLAAGYSDVATNLVALTELFKTGKIDMISRLSLTSNKKYYEYYSFYNRNQSEFKLLARICDAISNPDKQEKVYGTKNISINNLLTGNLVETKSSNKGFSEYSAIEKQNSSAGKESTFKPIGNKDDYDDITADMLDTNTERRLSLTIYGTIKIFQLKFGTSKKDNKTNNKNNKSTDFSSDLSIESMSKQLINGIISASNNGGESPLKYLSKLIQSIQTVAEHEGIGNGSDT